MTKLAMTKIVTANLEGLERFYGAVCGFDQVQRIAGEGFREAIMTSAASASGAALVLFADGSNPPPGELVLVFETDDIAAFSAKVVENGGAITHPAQHVPELGLSFMMGIDPEGHVIEAVRHDPA